MIKLLFINWEWRRKPRVQFCVGEMDVTAGVAEVLHPCCPLSCIGSLVFICFCAELFANSAGSCLPLLFFFIPLFLFLFSPPGYFSASWTHWNWLCAGSDKHWNQHKKGQKCVDCRKDVISFISLGMDLVAWNNSMVVNEYGWGDGFVPKASRSMSKMAKCNFPALWSQNK